jgi:hypothetical protein
VPPGRAGQPGRASCPLGPWPRYRHSWRGRSASSGRSHPPWGCRSRPQTISWPAQPERETGVHPRLRTCGFKRQDVENYYTFPPHSFDSGKDPIPPVIGISRVVALKAEPRLPSCLKSVSPSKSLNILQPQGYVGMTTYSPTASEHISLSCND